jgi:translation initiation factor IF-1
VVETFAPLPGRMAVSALAMVNGDLVALGMDLDTDPRAGVILRLQP